MSAGLSCKRGRIKEWVVSTKNNIVFLDCQFNEFFESRGSVDKKLTHVVFESCSREVGTIKFDE